MADFNKTTKSDLDFAVPEHWESKVRIDAGRKSFWGKFEGKEGSNQAIIVKNDFTKGKMDKVHIQTVAQVNGDVVRGENVLKGNEYKMSLGQFDLTVDYVRLAMAFTAKATKESNFDNAMIAGRLLSSRLSRAQDEDMFTGLLTTASPDRMYAGDATSSATLTTNDTYGMTEVDRMVLALGRKGAIPISLIKKGKEEFPIYACVISGIDRWNLKADPMWVKAQEMRDRGENNPLITMAYGMTGGMLVYVHQGLTGMQGTPMRPESAILGNHAADATTITVGADDGIDYTKFFASSGTIAIVNGSGEKEFVGYTGKTKFSFTTCTRGDTYGGTAADGASTYVTGNLVTQSNHKSTVIGFGAEIAAKSYGQYPRPIQDKDDYGFNKGLGLEMIYGCAAIKNKAGKYPNYLVMETYAGNPSVSI